MHYVYLFPVLLLVLLPFLTCLIIDFSIFTYVQKKAYSNHQKILNEAQDLLLHSNQNYSDLSGSDNSESISQALLAVNQYAAVLDREAKIIILSENLNISLPRDPDYQEALRPLAKDLSDAIQSGSLPDDGLFISSSNTYYHITLKEFKSFPEDVRYLICYTPITLIKWLYRITIIILITTSVLSILVLLSIRRSSNKIISMLRYLSLEAERIGSGDFSLIEKSFNIQELEEFRIGSNKMLERLNEAKKSEKDFIINLSHKLRTRFMTISSFAQGLEYNLVSSPSETGRIIRKENEELIEEVTKLLTFSRLNDPLSNTDLEKVPVIEILENSIDRFSQTGKANGLQLCYEKSSAELFAIGNEDLLEDIFDNLFSNAIRYAQLEICIDVKEESENIKISVSDDGKGLSDQDLEHVFDRFYKGKDGNSGLGLSIAQKAAERMGGKITASNRDGGGAMFTLYLKRADAA